MLITFWTSSTRGSIEVNIFAMNLAETKINKHEEVLSKY